MLIILLTLIFLRPFISSLAFISLNYIYSVAFLVFLIFWFIYKGKALREIKFINYPLFLFCFTLILSISFSKNQLTSFEELYKYAGGLSLFLIAASLKERGRKLLIYTISFSALIISLLAIYQYLFGFKSLLSYISKQQISDPFVMDYIDRKRVFFPFVTPNILGGYLAMAIPLCFAHKYRALFIAPMSIALILTKSMGALLVFYLGLALYFLLAGKFKKKQILFLSGLLITLCVIFVLRTTMQKEHIQPLFSTLARLNYWEETVKLIGKSPLVGVGLGNFNLPQSRYAHNSYLQIWAEMGILGIISFLWLIIITIKNSLNPVINAPDKIKAAALISANVVFLAHNLIDFSFFLPEVAFIWWLIAGLTLQNK